MSAVRKPRWDDWEIGYVRRWYPHMPTAELAEQLGRTGSSVYQLAYRFGLRKVKAYYRTYDAGRLDGKRGAASRFRAGHVPWNKGTHWKAGGRSAETRFKKGQKPHSWQPVGAERVTRDGILQRKVTDTGYPPRDWRPVHVLHWERYRGPVPDGYILVFKNGNRRDIRIANLELITRAENMRRNSIHNYPPEIKRSMHAVGVLKRVIRNRRERA